MPGKVWMELLIHSQISTVAVKYFFMFLYVQDQLRMQEQNNIILEDVILLSILTTVHGQ